MRELTINEVNFIAAAGDFSYAELGGAVAAGAVGGAMTGAMAAAASAIPLGTDRMFGFSRVPGSVVRAVSVALIGSPSIQVRRRRKASASAVAH